MNARGRMHRRALLQTSSATAAGLMLTAHGATASANRGSTVLARAAQSGTVPLTVWHTHEDELLPLIEAFEAENPNVEITFQYYPFGEFFDKLSAAYAAGDPPDVHRQDDDEIPFFVQRGAVLSLDDHFSDLPQDELYWNIVEATRVDGKLWFSVPAFRVGNLIYNKTMFEEAGVALPPETYPSEEWTWDVFAETARKLSKPEELQFGAGNLDHMDFVTSMVRSNGGDILSEDCMGFRLGEPAAVEVIQKMVDLIHKDKAAADPETQVAMGDAGEMFDLGRLGMVFAETRDVPPDDVDFEWGYAGLPVFPGKEPTVFAAIEVYGVPAVTEYPKEAAAFAASLMSQEAQQILAETKNVIPINRAAAQKWAETGKVPGRDLLLQVIPYAKTLPFALGFGRVQDLTWPIFGEVFLGQKSVEEGVAEAVTLANDALQEVGGCLGEA